METTGLEPATPTLQRWCATSCATSPGERSTLPQVAGPAIRAKAIGGGVADVEGVGAGDHRDAHASVGGSIAAADRPSPSAPSSTASRSGTATSNRSSAAGAGVNAHVSKPCARSVARSAGQLVAPGDAQVQHLAHAHPDRAPVVRVDARRVEHEAVDPEGAGRTGDGPDVLRVVEPLEHGDPACRPRSTSSTDGSGRRSAAATAPRWRSKPTVATSTGARRTYTGAATVRQTVGQTGVELRSEEDRAHDVVGIEQPLDRRDALRR